MDQILPVHKLYIYPPLSALHRFSGHELLTEENKMDVPKIITLN
jgi:hypothetical protein